MRRRASPMRWRQYLCRAGSAQNSVEAAWIAAAMAFASIGPSRSAKEAMVRCHCDCAGPNATRIVSSRSNRMARGSFMRWLQEPAARSARIRGRDRSRCGRRIFQRFEPIERGQHRLTVGHIARQSPLAQGPAEIAGISGKDDFAAVEPQPERLVPWGVAVRRQADGHNPKPVLRPVARHGVPMMPAPLSE